MNSENGRKLTFKRVENPEGWKPVYECQVGYICTNIGRDAAAWGDNELEIDIANKLLETPDIFQFYDREGNHVSSPTPEEIIWPRFTTVEVDGGWSVLDQWLNERLQNSTISKQFCDQTVNGWNAGDYSKSDFQWIPHELPAPAPEPEAQYIACQHQGKWEGDFEPEDWGVCRAADDCWCEACEDSKESATNLVDGINNNNGQFTNWRWYRPRKVDAHETPQSETQEPLTQTGDSQAEIFLGKGLGALPEIDLQEVFEQWARKDPRHPKYLRTILGTDINGSFTQVTIDVYAVLDAFSLPHRLAHAVKKLLCAGMRDKGDIQQDLNEAIQCIKCELHQLDTSKNNGHDKQEANG